MSYLLLVIADILLSINFVCSKKYQLMRGVTAKAAYFSVAIMGLFTAVLFFCINGFKIEFSIFSILISLCYNLAVTAYSVIGRYVIHRGSLALYTLFLMSGGMLVPYVWGILFRGENFTIRSIFGIVLIILAILISNTTQIKLNVKFILLCFAVFFLNGFTSIFSKIHQTTTAYPTVNTTDFVIWGGIIRLVIGGIMFITEYKKGDDIFDKPKSSTLSVLVLPMLSTLASGLSSLLQLYSAKTVPATVLYPFITGGSIIFTSLAGMILYKEKLTKEILASISICFIGTLLFL